MKYNMDERKYWFIGDHNIVRLSKDNCQRILYGLVACQGQLHTCFSTCIKDGGVTHGIKVGSADASFTISLPIDAADDFEKIAGIGILEEPYVIHGN